MDAVVENKDIHLLSFLPKPLPPPPPHLPPVAITKKDHKSILDAAPLPYIPLKPNLVIGRPHLNILPSAACGCLKRLQHSKGWEAGCPVCQEKSSFTLKYASMKMFKFRCEESDKNIDNCNHWSVEWIGRNDNLVYLNGDAMKRGVRYPFTHPLTHTVRPSTTNHYSWDMIFQLRNHNGVTISEYVIDVITLASCTSTPIPKVNTTTTITTTTTTTTLDDLRSDGKCHSNLIHEKGRIADVNSEPVILDCNRGHQSNQTSSKKDTVLESLPTPPPSPPPRVILPLVDKNTSTHESVIDLASSSTEDDVVLSKVEPIRGIPSHNAIFFLQRGLNMTSTRIKKLIQVLESNMTGENRLDIQSTFDQKVIPKYLVIDPVLSKEIIRTALGFKDLRSMAIALVDVFIVKPEFIVSFHNFDPPAPQHFHLMMEEIRKIYNRLQTGPKANVSCSEWFVRKRPMTEFATVQILSASSSDCDFIKKMRMQKTTNPSTSPGRNEEISQLLEKISIIYKESPIEKHDVWRSYMYKICSTRLLHLDFEVSLDPSCMERLQKIKGFGSSIQQTIRDFLLFDKCNRLKALESDVTRKGMRNLSKIWGIGSATALELVKKGYFTIEDIREAIELGELELTENQNIGVKYYEDFQEKMPRDETREIGKKVTEAVKRFFFDAEVMIMGSYRRGAMQNGDIDILITLPKYKYGDKATPNGALDELVERLKEERYISHHLTSVDPEYHRRMPSQDDDFIDDYLPKYGHQMYMGVFNSPYFPGKMRRIDIKFYPYRDKAFAMLYFTGNGYFNRAMRLYAKQRKQMKLSDCGLYVMSLGREGKRIECKTENDIFNALGLVYFDPCDRDGMDAVRVKDDTAPGGSLSQVHPTEDDVMQDSQHPWIE